MHQLKKLFGGINLTWKKLIIFSLIAGIYTALMALIPAVNKTSFHDIAVTFEVWILFGIIIIMNSKSAKDSAAKCFVFFLISQPLVYLIQVPFSSLGFGIFVYYKYWFIWTLLTIPMGFAGYYLKKDRWWGLIILTPVLVLLGTQYYTYLKETIFYFPYHLLTTIFCFITIILYSICIFNDQKIRIVSVIISIIIIVAASFMACTNRFSYTINISSDTTGVEFNDKCNVYLEDSSLGSICIEYNDVLEEYIISATFTRAGKTHIILEDENGNRNSYEITVNSNTYSVSH